MKVAGGSSDPQERRRSWESRGPRWNRGFAHLESIRTASRLRWRLETIVMAPSRVHSRQQLSDSDADSGRSRGRRVGAAETPGIGNRERTGVVIWRLSGIWRELAINHPRK